MAKTRKKKALPSPSRASEHFRALYAQLGGIDRATFEDLLPDIILALQREKSEDFLLSCWFEHKAVLSDDEKHRISATEALISASMEHLGNIWAVPSDECSSLRTFYLAIQAGKPYSRHDVAKILAKRSELMESFPTFFPVKDVRMLTQIVLTSLYCSNVIEAHQLLLTVNTPLRTAYLQLLLFGMRTLEVHLKYHVKGFH